jgi:UV excision repair protein RAD23
MLEPILQQVGQGNPQLAALIAQNPDAFLHLLSEGVEGDDGEGGPWAGEHTIAVTPEEAAAIDRVCF